MIDIKASIVKVLQESYLEGSATLLQTAQYIAIEAVNIIVECSGVSFEDRQRAIMLVREHLDARAEQCRPVTPINNSVDSELSELLGL